MDEDIKINHSKDCDCTYCDKETQKEFESILGAKAADLGDGMGKANPDLHLFAQQSKGEVLKMFKQLEDAKKQKKDFFGKVRPLAECGGNAYASIMDAPAHHKPCLTFEDAPKCSEYIGEPVNIRATGKCIVKEPPETMALWRKLAGTNPQENVEAAKKIPTIMDAILLMCKRKFVSGLTVEWSNDHWNSCLVINGAKTKINSEDLVAALEGLQHITDADDAAKIVSDVVVKKIERLFI